MSLPYALHDSKPYSELSLKFGLGQLFQHTADEDIDGLVETILFLLGGHCLRHGLHSGLKLENECIDLRRGLRLLSLRLIF